MRDCPTRKGKGGKNKSFNHAAWHTSPTQRGMEQNFAEEPPARAPDAGSTPQYAGPMAGTTSWFVDDAETDTDDYFIVDMTERRYFLPSGIAQLDFESPPASTRGTQGSEVVSSGPEPEPDTATWTNPLPDSRRVLTHWAWWRDDDKGQSPATLDHFHVRMASRKGEALLIDPGSPDNLMGDAWSERMSALAVKAGHGPAKYEPIAPFKVGGVGKEAQTCQRQVCHHIGLDQGEVGTFTGPELPESAVPALLGLRSLESMRCLLDVPNMQLYRVGPGGYQLRLSPGSRVNQLERGNSGHLMLPCSEFSSPPSPSRPPTHLHARAASSSE